MKISKREFKSRWNDPGYVALVEKLARELKSDGCTGVLDFYLLGCYEHDIAYRTHRDPYYRKISKWEADKRFRWYIQLRSPFGVLSPMSWWRWLGVKWFADKAWDQIRDKLPIDV